MKKKLIGLSVLLFVYIFAIGIGIGSYILFNYLGLHDFLSILIADVLATIFVWLLGVIFKTASMYDPYWSIQSLVIYLGLLIKYNNWNIGTILLLVVIAIYSIRLTTNFVIGLDSLSYVDWRYKMLKAKSGKLYQLVNLFGICMFPTLVVYACTLPLIVYAQIGTFSLLNIVGLSIIVIGVLLELISDIQMKQFIKTRESRSDVINIGLWKYSRHPNYLGEIFIWFGPILVLMSIAPQYWYLFAGAVVNLLMFLFISIPMEERHMKEYKDKEKYDLYIKSTSPLLILPKRERKTRYMIGIYAYFVVIVDIIFAMIFLPQWFKQDNQSEYRMDELTIDRYNNLLSYMNKEANDLSLPSSSDIISISYSENHLYIMSDQAIYFDITTNENDVNISLQLFNEDKPLGSYMNTIIVEEINTSLELNTRINVTKSLVTNDISNNYVSYTGLNEEGYVSVTHHLYMENGEYNETTVVENENKAYFDMLYYLSNK